MTELYQSEDFDFIDGDNDDRCLVAKQFNDIIKPRCEIEYVDTSWSIPQLSKSEVNGFIQRINIF